MRTGDFVKYKEVVDPGDDDLMFIVTQDPYFSGGIFKVMIEAVVQMNFRPTYLVDQDRIELCAF